MLAEQRRQEILRMLRAEGVLAAASIAERLGVSPATVAAGRGSICHVRMYRASPARRPMQGWMMVRRIAKKLEPQISQIYPDSEDSSEICVIWEICG